MSEQATTEQIGQVPTNGGRQCSGCHRRNADLALFENGKLYCMGCAANVSRLGIEPVVRDRSVEIAEAVTERADPVDDAGEADEQQHDDTVSEKEPVMANRPVEPEEIAVLPSLATQSLDVFSAAASSVDVGLHGVLEAERARLLEQRTELDRRFRSDVEAIDARLMHVESLLGEQPESRAS